MMTIQSYAIGWTIHYLVGELATSAGKVNWSDVKTKVNAIIASKVHNAWLASTEGKVVAQVIDAVAKLCEEDADTELLLKDLAAQDWQGAELEIKKELATVLPEDVSVMLLPGKAVVA